MTSAIPLVPLEKGMSSMLSVEILSSRSVTRYEPMNPVNERRFKEAAAPKALAPDPASARTFQGNPQGVPFFLVASSSASLAGGCLEAPRWYAWKGSFEMEDPGKGKGSDKLRAQEAKKAVLVGVDLMVRFASSERESSHLQLLPTASKKQDILWRLIIPGERLQTGARSTLRP
ncbi:hypothetical protein AYO22_02709 [Fonsecaea multimorphosa]|nr:hypothetical protein AYO22_02709 [Fonsecaea multimorphosa]